MKKSFIASAAIVAVIFAGAGIYFGTQHAAPAKQPSPVVGQLMKMTLADSKGQQQKLSQWQGKFLVVNFWATWCGPCVQEMPELSALQGELASKNIQLLGLGIDSPSNIAEFADKYKITYPVFAAGMDGTELSRQMGNQAGGLPFTVLIAPDGSLVKSYLGRLNMNELRADITKLTM
ncbi:TlpA disulfide reductase family protein [Undibacterium sp. TJN25]|uniref:TlpA disulfide reductase family protein n=1 Tax=Undibacterium sp. TJN25 TaxID=3413056 RepID=UPI003BF25657